MSLSLILAFWAVSLALVVTPGADWAYAISAGMRDRALAPAVAGLLSGYVAITLVVAAGVGTLVAGIPSILTALTVLGAAYLTWLGIGLLRDPPVPTAGDEEAIGARQWIVKGFGISGLNPKALLLFLALLPQFTSRTAAWPIPAQIATLGLVHMASCGIIYSLVGLGSRAVLKSRPSAARVVGRISGTIMIVLAVVLVAEHLLPALHA